MRATRLDKAKNSVLVQDARTAQRFEEAFVVRDDNELEL